MPTTTLGRVVRAKRISNPYKHLAAGVIACAVDDARSGDGNAYAWLQGDGYGWIAILAPGDVETLQRSLVKLAMPNGNAPARQMSFADLDILELD